MKKAVLVLALCVLFFSCVKDLSESAKPVNQQSASVNADVASASALHYGALTVPGNDIPSKINILKGLGVNYVRYTITMSSWTGSNYGFQQYTDNGFHIICNINYNTQPLNGEPPVPFAKDTVAFKNKLTDILNKCKPEVIAVENEETNQLYHIGPMSQYISELKAAITVAHAKGVKVTDGGIHPQGICYYVWKYYKDNGMTQQADDWMNKTFNSGMKYAAQHPELTTNTFNIYWRQIDTLLNAFTTSKIDYVNLHAYEPINDMSNGITTIPGCIQTMASYIKWRTGKPLMSNECGQRNTNSSLVTSMLQAFTDGNYPYAIWYSADGPNTGALTNLNGTLRSNGTAYKNFVTAH